MDGAELADRIRATALEHGLDDIGFAAAEVFESTLADLRERRSAGYSADMAFTYRNPERSTDPTRILDGARTLIVGARSYLAMSPLNESAGPVGDTARYVWDDHYGALRSGLDAVASVVRSDGFAARVVLDDNALVDREAAYRAGLGWYGKNANILLPGRGSWFVLGAVVTDAVLAPATPVRDGCGACERCLNSCPTAAIVAPGVIDARRCLAWLVQARGVFPHEYREALGSRIYGCDDCQEVCPPNKAAERRAVAVAPPGRRRWVGLLDLLSLDDSALMQTYGAWYIADRDPDYLRRNALIALGNSNAGHDPEVRATIARHVASTSAIVVAHAVWAANRLGFDELVAAAAGHTDPIVVAELDRIRGAVVG